MMGSVLGTLPWAARVRWVPAALMWPRGHRTLNTPTPEGVRGHCAWACGAADEIDATMGPSRGPCDAAHYWASLA